MRKIKQMINDVLDQQEKKGIETYGQTLEQCDDNAYSWNVMALEELVDGMQYLAKENMKLNKEKQELIEIIESVVHLLENQVRMGTLAKLDKYKK